MKQLISDDGDIIEYPFEQELATITDKLLAEYNHKDVLIYMMKIINIQLYRFFITCKMGV